MKGSSSRKTSTAADDTQLSCAAEDDEQSDMRGGTEANRVPSRESSIMFTERRTAHLTEKYGDLTSQESLGKQSGYLLVL